MRIPSHKQKTGSKPVNEGKSTSVSLHPPDLGINFTIQKKENKTGLPNNLKSGIENLSGMDISDVKVHYNSAQPAQLNAHAFAQGNQIHVAPGQEKHLPHEAWHVVQQKQGRVKPTKQLKSAVNINDDVHLEKEADVMGVKALQAKSDPAKPLKLLQGLTATQRFVIQRLIIDIAPSEPLGQKALKSRSFSEDNLVQDGADEKKEHASPELKRHEKTISGWGAFWESGTEKQIREQVQVNLADINFGNVGVKEPVIFAGHGLTKTSKKNVKTAVAQQGYTVDDFVKILSTLPKDYSSTIYLQGCYTASGKKQDFSDSFAMQVFAKLVKKFPKITVKANLGASLSLEKGITISHDHPPELDRMKADYKKLYEPCFAKLEHLTAQLNEIEARRPEEAPYTDQAALNALLLVFAKSEKTYHDAMMSAGMATFKKDSDRTAAEHALVANEAFLKKQTDALRIAINQHQAEKNQQHQAFLHQEDYRAWRKERNSIKKSEVYKTLFKLNDDLEKGIVSFSNMAAHIKLN